MQLRCVWIIPQKTNKQKPHKNKSHILKFHTVYSSYCLSRSKKIIDILIIMCISYPYCDSKQLQKFKGLQQSLISKFPYMSVAASQLLWLFSTRLSFWRSSPVWVMLVSRQRRENKRAGGIMQCLFKCLLPSGVCHICVRATGQRKWHSQAESQWSRDVSCGQSLGNSRNV